MNRGLAVATIFAVLATIIIGCVSFGAPPLDYTQTYQRAMVVTGYCECKKCTNWKRNWRGQAVVADGASEGRPKDVGVTASGTYVRPGTVAADTNLYPFGTVMYIPGYGYGTVEDRGSAIQGEHIDLYFRTHAQALQWGRQHKNVTVYTKRTAYSNR